MGFVVMSRVEEAEALLALGDEQEVGGAMIQFQHFQRRSLEEDGFDGEADLSLDEPEQEASAEEEKEEEQQKGHFGMQMLRQYDGDRDEVAKSVSFALDEEILEAEKIMGG